MFKFGVSRCPPALPNVTGFAAPIPRLKIPVKNRPRGLKHPEDKSAEGRHNVIKRHLTDLFRLERVEMNYMKADECRQYAERLIQLAIQYGDTHKPTMEMADYWLLEKDLVHKLFKVFVPRYQQCHHSYTQQFRLPQEYRVSGKITTVVEAAVLELRGNCYPPVIPSAHQELHDKSLLNGLLEESAKRLGRKTPPK